MHPPDRKFWPKLRLGETVMPPVCTCCRRPSCQAGTLHCQLSCHDLSFVHTRKGTTPAGEGLWQRAQPQTAVTGIPRGRAFPAASHRLLCVLRII